MTPIEFLSLVPEFRDPSWAAWRSVIAALFGVEPEDPALVLEVTGRATPPASPAWESFWICGRGAGKSRVSALIATYFATARTYKRVAGEQVYVIVMAPDRRQAAVTHRYITGLLHAVPALAALVTNETRESIELSGVTIEVTTADFRTVRGRTVALAIVEEGAFLPTDNSATPDAELLRALRPALARVPGSMLLFVSSPYARRGELYRAYREHFGKDGDTLVVKAPTLRMNPAFDARAIQKAFDEDPSSAAAEYGAEFRSDIESFLSREAVEAVVVPGRRELPRIKGVTYRAFLDFAGGSGGDSATLAIAHTEKDVQVLDVLRERRPPFSPEAVCAEFADVIRNYGISKATSDRWGGEFPVEQMRKLRVAVEPSARPKSDLYRELLPLVNSRRVELLDDPRLIAQLTGLERRVGRGGKDSIDHAPGSHDDVANAATGALTAGTGAPQYRVRALSDGPVGIRVTSLDRARLDIEDWRIENGFF